MAGYFTEDFLVKQRNGDGTFSILSVNSEDINKSNYALAYR